MTTWKRHGVVESGWWIVRGRNLGRPVSSVYNSKVMLSLVGMLEDMKIDEQAN